VCTVVCRWDAQAAFPVQLLALRDELASRAFDLPGAWWPGQPEAIGGRDRQAGGSWCVSDVASAVTSVVLNRPERPVAAEGAPSRGILPLLAVRHRERWPEQLDVQGMASFILVLLTPQSLDWWSFDGVNLSSHTLAGGTYMFTTRGIRQSGFDERFEADAAGFSGDLAASTERAWNHWLAVVRESMPTTDPIGLLVRRSVGGDSFETVFGQFIAAQPGTLRLDYAPTPDSAQTWTTKLWNAPPG
jgi:hypothetical protein